MKFISPPEEVSCKDQPEPETPPKSHQKTLSPKNPWTVRKSFQRLFGDTMSEEVEGRETVLGVSRCVIVGVIGRINCDPYYHNGNRTEILSYRCLDADWQTLSCDCLVRRYFKKIPNLSRCRGKTVSNVKDHNRELQKITTLQTSGRPFSLAITTTPSLCTSSTGIRNSFDFTVTVPEILYIIVICRPIWSSSVSFTLKQLF